MRVLIDESLPIELKDALTGFEVSTVKEMGWRGLKNGELLKRTDELFDVLITADKNLRYQQNLRRFKLTFIIFPSNHFEIVLKFGTRAKAALAEIKSGEIVELA
jgi:hypothetical protein